MEDYQKINSIVKNALFSNGWGTLGGSEGAFIKNDCIFVNHAFPIDGGAHNSINCIENCRAFQPVLCTPSGCDWHIERFGWLLASGKFDATFSSIYDETALEETVKAWDMFISDVIAIAEKSEIALKSIKSRLRTRVRKDSKLVSEFTGDKIQPGGYFKVATNSAPDPFKINWVYKLESIVETGFYVKTLSASLTGFRKNGDLLIPHEYFLELVQNRIIADCKIANSAVEVSENVWVPLGAADVDFPTELRQFVSDKDKQLIVAEAFANAVNITPFLQPRSKEALQALLDMSKAGFEVGSMCGVLDDALLIRKLTSFKELGYTVQSLVDAEYSAGYVEEIFEEMFPDLRDKESSLRSAGYNDEQVKFLVGLFFDGINTQPYEDSSFSSLEMQLMYFGDSHPEFSSVVSLFKEKALSGEDGLYVSADFLTAKEKSTLRSVFSTSKELEILGMSWNEYVGQVLQSLHTIYFVPELGFLLRTGTIGLGVVDNSYFITGLLNKPEWRATLINETFFVNRNNEKYCAV